MNSQKPIEYDISFKYLCENCGASHWLFLREAQTEGFKVVCECNNVFTPATISTVDIIYANDCSQPTKTDSVDFSRQSVKTIMAFGYSEIEASDMVNQSLALKTFDNANDLVKYSLKTFGTQYV